MIELNETHNLALRSWLASANDKTNTCGADFPIQNLPFGIFKRKNTAENFRGGVAIGDQIFDLSAGIARKLFSGLAVEAASATCADSLNALMAMGNPASSALRRALSRLLREGAAERILAAECLVPQSDAEYRVPARIGDYTDFYTSIHHATNIGRQFRPDQPLLPNYK